MIASQQFLLQQVANKFQVLSHNMSQQLHDGTASNTQLNIERHLRSSRRLVLVTRAVLEDSSECSHWILGRIHCPWPRHNGHVSTNTLGFTNNDPHKNKLKPKDAVQTASQHMRTIWEQLIKIEVSLSWYRFHNSVLLQNQLESFEQSPEESVPGNWWRFDLDNYEVKRILI